jgi:hypothetical protein
LGNYKKILSNQFPLRFVQYTIFQILSEKFLPRLAKPFASLTNPLRIAENKGFLSILSGENRGSTKPQGLAQKSRKNHKFGTPWSIPVNQRKESGKLKSLSLFLRSKDFAPLRPCSAFSYTESTKGGRTQ